MYLINVRHSCLQCITEMFILQCLVDGAIHTAAGQYLLEESKSEYRDGCETGDAKMTGGYQLPAKCK